MIKLVVYSNCQGTGIAYFLEKIIKNIKIDYISNYTLIYNQKPISNDIIKNLKECDIFIYQPIKKKHGIYSTSLNYKNNIMSYLSSNCKLISFPYIYNSSFWIFTRTMIRDRIPISDNDEVENYINTDSTKTEYADSEPITDLKKQGYSLNDILKMYSNNQINFNFKKRFDKCIKILREKEKECDIKVSNFIIKNYKKRELFLTSNHPTSCIFIHCVNQILPMIGFYYNINMNEHPINAVELPGKLSHSSYDKNYFNFEFDCDIDDNIHLKHIENIYNKN